VVEWLANTWNQPVEVITLFFLPEASSAGVGTLFSPFYVLLSDADFQNGDYQELGGKK